jgi:hypothetical protein
MTFLENGLPPKQAKEIIFQPQMKRMDTDAGRLILLPHSKIGHIVS